MRLTDGPWPVWEILPRQLYQRAKLHGYTSEVKEAGIRQLGITHAIALAPLTPDPDLGYLLDEYTHLPVPDGLLRANGPVFRDHARRLAGVIQDGGVVMTMCNAGRNRSGLMSALILVELTGMSGGLAIDVVRHHRPRALANPHFEAFLEEIL